MRCPAVFGWYDANWPIDMAAGDIRKGPGQVGVTGAYGAELPLHGGGGARPRSLLAGPAMRLKSPSDCSSQASTIAVRRGTVLPARL
jgi:hypothetical protein